MEEIEKQNTFKALVVFPFILNGKIHIFASHEIPKLHGEFISYTPRVQPSTLWVDLLQKKLPFRTLYFDNDKIRTNM